jgi:hypothetical protein
MRIAGVVACLAVAATYVVVWPGWKQERAWRGGVRFVLRWFHALTWVLIAAWVWSANPGWGIAALVCYAVFLMTWFGARRS